MVGAVYCKNMMKLNDLLSFRRILSVLVMITLIISSLRMSYAQTAEILPEPGQMVGLSASIAPAMLRGFSINPRDPFSFEFLMDRGQVVLTPDEKGAEYQKLIKYFLASLAIPEKDLWVNLSPYENNRIIEENFGSTAMGRDLLAQDYILKQIAASLIHPDSASGKIFWDRVYKAAADKYGTTNIPVDTFNKVWIMPDQAEVYAKGRSVVLVKSHLKVMLDADYEAIANNRMPTGGHVAPQGYVSPSPRPSDQALNMQATQGTNPSPSISVPDASTLTKDIMREIILPMLEKEVNEGANFAPVRQITSALILATWYKKQWRQHLLNPVYSDRSKVRGIDQDPANNAAIYDRYVQAFKQGVFNFIKEEVDSFSQEPVPRKYFSGGYTLFDAEHDQDFAERIIPVSTPPSSLPESDVVKVELAVAAGNVPEEMLPVVKTDAEFKEKYWRLVEQDDYIKKGRVDPKLEDSPVRIGAMFGNYFKKHQGSAFLKTDHLALYNVLKGKSLTGEDSFDVIAVALKEALELFYKNTARSRYIPSGEKAVWEALIVQAVELVQSVLVDANAFEPGMVSTADIIRGSGWNSSSLAMATVLLTDMIGVRGISMVELDVHSDVPAHYNGAKYEIDPRVDYDIYRDRARDPDKYALAYPVYNVSHCVNLVRIGQEHFILDQGRQIKPVSVMVIDDQYQLTSADDDELEHDRNLFGLDIARLKRHLLAYQELRKVEIAIDHELTKENFKLKPKQYALSNIKLRGEFTRVRKKDRAVFWTEVSRSRISDVLYTKLQPDRWEKKDEWPKIRESLHVTLDEFKVFIEQADSLLKLGSEHLDPELFRAARNRDRLVAQALTGLQADWREIVHDKEIINDVQSYFEWKTDLGELEKLVWMCQERANALDISVQLFTVTHEVEAGLDEVYKINQNDPRTAVDILIELDKRIDLFLVVVKAKRHHPLFATKTFFKTVAVSLEHAKEIINENLQEVMDPLLDAYNAPQIDHGQAPNPLGGIDLDPSKFDIKARGMAEAMLTEVPAMEAARIEGLLPRILSIAPGEAFVKRLGIK